MTAPGAETANLLALGGRVRPDSFVVVLTGAGISAESGVRTFRDSRGLWEEHRIEDVASPEGFRRDPALVHRFYNARRRQLLEVGPNAAHQALADFQARWGERVLLITQNVDDLHERAGQRDLIHMHGELRKVRCQGCEAVLEWDGDTDVDSVCPECGRTGTLRPHIVWFGERPLGMDRIEWALDRCGLFLSIGTSGHVYPAAGFVEAVRPGVPTVELNLEPSLGASRFEFGLHDRASVLVPSFLDGLLTACGR